MTMNKALALSPLPKGLTVEQFPQLPSLPNDSCGSALRWDPGYAPKPVYFGSVQELHLFGFQLNLSHASCDDEEPLEGYLVQYAVVDTRSEDTHFLEQRRSVTYSSSDESRDFLEANEFDWKNAPCRVSPPRWKPEAAYWPTCGGREMTFYGQWNLPENEITKQYFDYDTIVFLFCDESEDQPIFKITTQPASMQTAEDHYADEEARDV